MKISPVAVFGFNRAEHLDRTLKALMNNELANMTPVFIFIDGARHDSDMADVVAVQNVARKATGFSRIEIVIRDKNAGLATSIIEGVSKVLMEYDSVIVLEDDLVTSPYFLMYMNKALVRYKYSKNVMSISAFGRKEVAEGLCGMDQFDAYFVPRNSSWGWGTWKDSWQLADWDVSDYEEFSNDKELRKQFSAAGEDVCLMLDLQQYGFLDSWAIRWTYAHFVNDGVSLVPYHSYVKNIGFDGSGTHCRISDRFDLDLTKAKKFPCFPELEHVREDTLAVFRYAHKQRLVSRLYWQARLLSRKCGLC